MSGLDLGEDPEGATPLEEEQVAGLVPSWITTRADLNEAEAASIATARLGWRRRTARPGSGRRPRNALTLQNLLEPSTLRELHRDMYADVWRWAGKYRTGDLNIGVPFYDVPVATKDLLDDAAYWFPPPSASAPVGVHDDNACRLHHRLVAIHPFWNGNGRHAREYVDLLLLLLGQPPFTWGSASLVDPTRTRRAYIDSLVLADHGDHEALRAFVRS